jgi:hypothetical protein
LFVLWSRVIITDIFIPSVKHSLMSCIFLVLISLSIFSV